MTDKELHGYITSGDMGIPCTDPDVDSGGKILDEDPGGFARQVIKIAESKGIPVSSFPDLTNMLFRLELDETIPGETSNMVEELLNWVLELNNMWELERRRQAEHSSDI